MTDTAVAYRTFMVADRDGLHARPCSRIARAAKKYKCVATARYEDRCADATSVLELLQLLAPGGAAIEFEASGPDAAVCLDAIAAEMAKEDRD